MAILKYNQLYKFKKVFSEKPKPPPLPPPYEAYCAKKGEIVRFKGKLLGYPHFESTEDGRVVVLSFVEVSEYLEEI